jgi:LPS-assembly protein
MKKLLIFGLFVLSSTANAQGYKVNCNNSSLLFPKQTLSNDDSLNVLADRSEVTKKDNYLLTGNVSLNSSAYYLSADEIKIKKSDKTSNAKGNVKYQDDKLMITADSAVVKKQNDINHSTLQQVKFHYPDAKINGTADKVINDGVYQTYNSVSYSLCPLGNTDWQIKADKISLNSDTNRGVANNVVIEFLGVPVFQSPNYEWVLKGRGSGFLAPEFGSYEESAVNKENNNYHQVSIPYYFNIAPDRDFLLTLNQMSSRGSVIKGKYRQLIASQKYIDSGRFEIEGHYLNEDHITKNKRWLLNSTIDLSLNTKTELNIVANRFSDQDYFKEIAHSNTSESALNSHIDLTYADTESNLNMAFFAEDEQLINDGDAKYTRAPEFSISKDFSSMGNRQVNSSFVSTKFAHQNSSKTTGVRNHAQIDFSRPIVHNAYSLEPTFNFSKTHYLLDNIEDQDRSIYSFGLDSKIFLEREVNLFDTDLIQTLTPRLAYNYTPDKDQSDLPNFDSVDTNNSYEGLFSGKKYTGIDNIASANDFTAGLESDFIDEETGETILSLKLAQTLYHDDIETNNDTRNYSDIAISADLNLNDLTFSNTLQYDPETNKIDKRDSSMSYILNPREFLTLARRYDGTQESADLSGSYQLTPNVHIFAGINHSITDSITNKETTGIAYESCCWALRLAHFKTHTDDGDYNYSTKFELVLKGLATTSPSLSKRLEDEVPNYLVDLNE